MSRTSKIWTQIVLGFCLLLLLGGYGIYWAFYMREHHRWTEDLKLWDGGRLHVQHHMSNKAYHGLVGHLSPFWWGGGDRRYEMQFAIGERQYYWQSVHRLVAIQPDEDGSVYIVALDCESEEARHRFGPMFRFYRNGGDGSWDEIASEDFPRHLAIQNRQCTDFNDGSTGNIPHILAEIERMDPAELEFRASLNGRLWAFLEDPNGKTTIDKRCPPESFARDFKSKWIRPISLPQLGNAPR